MMERQNFSVLHALLRRAHPNGRAVECAITARDADSQFIRRQILAQPLPAARAADSQFFQKAHALRLFLLFGVWGEAPCLPIALALPPPPVHILMITLG